MREALGLRIRASMEARLGRCSRCMTMIAVLVIASWLLVAALSRMQPSVGVLVSATLIATGFSLLGVAHAAAFAARRLAPIVAPASHVPFNRLEVETAGATVTLPGCGCGQASVAPPPLSQS